MMASHKGSTRENHLDSLCVVVVEVLVVEVLVVAVVAVVAVALLDDR